MQEPIIDAIPHEFQQMDVAIQRVAEYIGSYNGDFVYIVTKPGGGKDFDVDPNFLQGLVHLLERSGKYNEVKVVGIDELRRERTERVKLSEKRVIHVFLAKLFVGNELIPFVVNQVFGEKNGYIDKMMTELTIGILEGIDAFPSLHSKGKYEANGKRYFLKKHRGILVVAPITIVDHIGGELLGVVPSKAVTRFYGVNSSNMWIRRARWLSLRTM